MRVSIWKESINVSKWRSINSYNPSIIEVNTRDLNMHIFGQYNQYLVLYHTWSKIILMSIRVRYQRTINTKSGTALWQTRKSSWKISHLVNCFIAILKKQSIKLYASIQFYKVASSPVVWDTYRFWRAVSFRRSRQV